MRLHLTDRAAGLASCSGSRGSGGPTRDASYRRCATPRDRRLAGNPLRDPRDRRLPRVPGAVRAGRVRRHRRPGPQEADPGRLRPGQPRPAAARLRAARVRPPRLGRRRLRRSWPARRPRTGARTGVPRGASGSGWRTASGSCPGRSTTTTPSTSWPRRSIEMRGQRTASRATPRSTCRSRRRCSRSCSSRCSAPGWPTTASRGGWRRVVVEKPFGHDLQSRPRAQRAGRRRVHRRRTSSASTTTSARRRSRTCWRCASPTRCSSRCGTATTSTRCRSRWPRTSASAPGPASTTQPARPATCCRTTSCSCSP